MRSSDGGWRERTAITLSRCRFPVWTDERSAHTAVRARASVHLILKNKTTFRCLEASLSAVEVSTVDANCVLPHGLQICFNKNVKHSWFLKLWGAFEVTYIGGDNISVVSYPPQCLAQGSAQSLWD